MYSFTFQKERQSGKINIIHKLNPQTAINIENKYGSSMSKHIEDQHIKFCYDFNGNTDIFKQDKTESQLVMDNTSTLKETPIYNLKIVNKNSSKNTKTISLHNTYLGKRDYDQLTNERESEKKFLKQTKNSLQLKSKKKLMTKDFKSVELERLKREIEEEMETTMKYNDFSNKDKLMNLVKNTFGFKITDQNKFKYFNFKYLKIIWFQFLSNEKLSKSYFKKMTSFEKIIFKTFLIRAGYIIKNKRFDMTYKEVVKLQQTLLLTEKKMLTFVLKEVLKKLIYPFIPKYSNFDFYSDLNEYEISYKTLQSMFSEYFHEVLKPNESIDDYLFSNQTFGTTESIINYIQKISCSKKLCNEIEDYFNNQKQNIFKRYKREIADKIKKRVSNYEIILNQFDHQIEKKSILKWMGRIIKDFALNPKVKIPLGVLELEESIKTFSNYLNHTK
jgi:hypothetical protein